MANLTGLASLVSELRSRKMKRLAFTLCFVLSVSSLGWGQSDTDRAYCEGGGYNCSYDQRGHWVCDAKADKKPGEDFWRSLRSGERDGATVYFALCSARLPGLLAHQKEMRLLNRKTGGLEITSVLGGKVKLVIGQAEKK